MMKKKNSDLNQAALKILQEGSSEAYSNTSTVGVPTKTTKQSEETKFEDLIKPTIKGTSKASNQKKELKSKKELQKPNTMETAELSEFEKQQIELAEAISRKEIEEMQNKSIIELARLSCIIV